MRTRRAEPDRMDALTDGVLFIGLIPLVTAFIADAPLERAAVVAWAAALAEDG